MSAIVHSNFRADLKDFFFHIFFGSISVCSKIVGLVATLLIFFAASNFLFVASTSAVLSSEGDLTDSKKKFFFGSSGFSSKIVDLVATSLIFLVM